MVWTRRKLLTLVGMSAIAACADDLDPAPTGSAVPSSPQGSGSGSAVPTPVPKLTDAGVARRVVNELRARAGDHPVIKVGLTADEAELSVLVDGKAITYAWREGTITEVGSDVAYVGQTSFDPDLYAFDDLQQLFGIAGALSGSLSNQQLQIVDHDQGDVMMTVTTRPESRPVFFRPDGSPIHELDYVSEESIREGLADAVGDRLQVAAIGFSTGQGLWVDSPHPTEAGVMVRRTRPAKLPAYTSQRKEDAPEKLFSPVDIDPAVLSKLVTQLPARLGKQPPVKVDWTIDFRHGRPEPTITLDVGGQTVVTDLEGLDITAEVGD
ncbi:hypothetical protein [Aestuariimicrobium ganziense]|uniref:hypothetical protein n=1 Tax=Aestuariimicrobium ganziense TaxID=2773677 RepID=UPI0019432B94|nr:hypothetical protein [Aestuariimicrobium ganziense]